MMKTRFLSLLAATMLAGCMGQEDMGTQATESAPWVRTVKIAPDGASTVTLTGTVRARYEVPVAFQIGGRIKARMVDAGQQVTAGQTLFRLDPRDLVESERAAAAALASAEAALATAEAELVRQRELVAREFVSRQAVERFELARREAASRLEMARAHQVQARNALAYAHLRAERVGVVLDVLGDPGQVVNVGQTVAMLALEGSREVEVFLADGRHAPSNGVVTFADGTEEPIVLREVAGAADPASRTWRARYRLQREDSALPLGEVVRVRLISRANAPASVRVPLAALDERGAGARIWRVLDGKAEPVPVEVLALDAEHAQARVDLPDDAHIIALGTHLLTPGMAVRERAQ
ncbi:MAG: efflux RND transporter periplasmic adaptor subunit [Burkholderiaceae bacterium]|nr:efflux RND transporter periplasmic adaptor subunit [Burkholderiaceae bacterium]